MMNLKHVQQQTIQQEKVKNVKVVVVVVVIVVKVKKKKKTKQNKSMLLIISFFSHTTRIIIRNYSDADYNDESKWK